MTTIYDEVYRRSRSDPEGFWGAAAEDVHWERRWDRVLDATHPPYYRWFAGGALNTCYNALDLHIDRGRGKQAALIYDSPVTQTVRVFTYLELRDAVLAGNQGRFVLRVRDGRGQLEPGGRGGPALAIGAFSSLYTGWASAEMLHRAGKLEGGSDAQRSALDAAFARHTTAAWLEQLAGRVPVAPVRDVGEALDSAFVSERADVADYKRAEGSPARMVAFGRPAQEDHRPIARPGHGVGASLAGSAPAPGMGARFSMFMVPSGVSVELASPGYS